MQMINELEIQVVREFAARSGFDLPEFSSWDAEATEVDRTLTQIGFQTEILTKKHLSVALQKERLVWDALYALLNDKVEVGFLVIIFQGYLSHIDGHAVGEPWPTSVETVEFYLGGAAPR